MVTEHAAPSGSAGAILRRYVYGPGTDEPLVWYEGSGTSDKRWLAADERGSVVAVTNASGAAIALDSYDEYGVPGAANLGRFQFTGQKWLAELGLYDYRARMYDPKASGGGRFLQTDPIGYADGPNWYGYVRSDPVNLTDPWGLNFKGSVTLEDGTQCTGTYDDGGHLIALGADCSPEGADIVINGSSGGGGGGFEGFGVSPAGVPMPQKEDDDIIVPGTRLKCVGIKIFGACLGRTVIVGYDTNGNEGVGVLPLPPVDQLAELQDRAVDCWHNPSSVSPGPVAEGVATGAAKGAAKSWLQGTLLSMIFGPEAAPAGAAGGAIGGGIKGGLTGGAKSVIQQACRR